MKIYEHPKGMEQFMRGIGEPRAMCRYYFKTSKLSEIRKIYAECLKNAKKLYADYVDAYAKSNGSDIDYFRLTQNEKAIIGELRDRVDVILSKIEFELDVKKSHRQTYRCRYEQRQLLLMKSVFENQLKLLNDGKIQEIEFL